MSITLSGGLNPDDPEHWSEKPVLRVPIPVIVALMEELECA
jgi:hypothetical protein